MAKEQEFDRSTPREQADGPRGDDSLRETMRRVAAETRREILRLAAETQRGDDNSN